MNKTVLLFGESEKGEIGSLYYISTMEELNKSLGNPPVGSKGLFFGVKSILLQYNLIYVRVKEEGFSTKDYLKGINSLQKYGRIENLLAIFIPGVGDGKIIDPLCYFARNNHAIVVTSESDLYDYLTSIQLPIIE